MDKLLIQAWRLLRVSSWGTAATAFVYNLDSNLTTLEKNAIIVGTIPTLEVLYRQLVPAKDKTWLGKLWAAVKVVESQKALTVPKPIAPLTSTAVPVPQSGGSPAL